MTTRFWWPRSSECVIGRKDVSAKVRNSCVGVSRRLVIGEWQRHSKRFGSMGKQAKTCWPLRMEDPHFLSKSAFRKKICYHWVSIFSMQRFYFVKFQKIDSTLVGLVCRVVHFLQVHWECRLMTYLPNNLGDQIWNIYCGNRYPWRQCRKSDWQLTRQANL